MKLLLALAAVAAAGLALVWAGDWMYAHAVEHIAISDRQDAYLYRKCEDNTDSACDAAEAADESGDYRQACHHGAQQNSQCRPAEKHGNQGS